MQLQGEHEIEAGRERVWKTLLDPREVVACVPGHPEIEVVDERHIRARVSVGGRLLRTTAVIDIVLTQLNPPSSATAHATASAMGGGASATAEVDLTELGATRTRLSWHADVSLSGMLTGFGSMVEGPAQRGIEDTFGCLKARIEAAEAAQAAG